MHEQRGSAPTWARNSWPRPAPPRSRPRSAPGCQRAPAGGRAPRGCPSTGSIVNNVIVRDLRLRARQARQERGTYRLRQAHEPGVGEQLEVQLEPALLPGRALPASAATAWWRSRTACSRARLLRRRTTGALAACQQVPAVAAVGILDDGPRRHAGLSELDVAPCVRPSPCPPRRALKWAPRRKLDRSRGDACMTIATSPRDLRRPRRAALSAHVPRGGTTRRRCRRPALHVDARAVVEHAAAIVVRGGRAAGLVRLGVDRDHAAATPVRELHSPRAGREVVSSCRVRHPRRA